MAVCVVCAGAVLVLSFSWAGLCCLKQAREQLYGLCMRFEVGEGDRRRTMVSRKSGICISSAARYRFGRAVRPCCVVLVALSVNDNSENNAELVWKCRLLQGKEQVRELVKCK